MTSKILCADVGTTSLKAGIIGQSGEVLSFSSRSYKISQDNSFIALEWERAFWECAKECAENSSFDAICISGNGPTIVSENGRTLLWSQNVPEITLKESHSIFIPRIIAFKNLYPCDYESSKYIFGCPEYLAFKLTGGAVTVLPEKRFEKAYWTCEQLDECGITETDRKKLPSFVGLGFCVGEVDFAGRKIPVFCAGPDFTAALIGTGTLFPGKICDRAGSSEGINLCTEKPIFAEGVRTLPSVIPELWNLGVLIPESGSLISAFRKEINLLEEKKNSYSDIIDFSFEDKNSEGFRILSEISRKVRSCVETLRKIASENNLPIENCMTSSGGQAKNPRWLLEKAKFSGIDIAVCECADAELLGDAIIANVSLNNFPDLQSAASHLVKKSKIYKSEKKIDTEFKVYKMPKVLKAIIFDIDSTLYTNSAYAFEQVDIQIRHFAKKNGITAREARIKISQWRKKWTSENSGKKISLGNTLTHFGVTIEESIKMREELLEPEKFLVRDETLVRLIMALKEKYKLICVTNNPVLPARKTLKALGIDELIPDIIGLDTCKKSKPAKEPFELAVKTLAVPPQNIISIGDRFDMDLSIPLEMEMGAVLVPNVYALYNLCEKLVAGDF